MRERILRLIDQANEWAGVLCAMFCIALILLVGALVIARYSFSAGSVALQDLSQWICAALVLLGFGYALRHQAHVRIDIFSTRFNTRLKARIEIAGVLLLLLPFCAFLIYASWPYVWASVTALEASASSGALPGLFLVKMLIPIGAASLALQGVAEILRAWPLAISYGASR